MSQLVLWRLFHALRMPTYTFSLRAKRRQT